jgi:hypothetical protein
LDAARAYILALLCRKLATLDVNNAEEEQVLPPDEIGYNNIRQFIPRVPDTFGR